MWVGAAPGRHSQSLMHLHANAVASTTVPTDSSCSTIILTQHNGQFKTIATTGTHTTGAGTHSWEPQALHLWCTASIMSIALCQAALQALQALQQAPHQALQLEACNTDSMTTPLCTLQGPSAKQLPATPGRVGPQNCSMHTRQQPGTNSMQEQCSNDSVHQCSEAPVAWLHLATPLGNSTWQLHWLEDQSECISALGGCTSRMIKTSFSLHMCALLASRTRDMMKKARSRTPDQRLLRSTDGLTHHSRRQQK